MSIASTIPARVLVCGALLVVGIGVRADLRAVPAREALDKPGLSAAIEQVRARQPFSGSVLVVKDEHRFAAGSYGYADRSRYTGTALDTRYRISGLTVAFTWIGLLQLRDAHRLDLDRSVCFVFRPCPPVWRPLTVRHLMGPSTGLKALPRTAFARSPPTLAQYVERLGREPLYFKPGTVVAHNTSRYYGGESPTVLAARVLEIASGESWSDYVRRHILQPAGMTSTGFQKSPRDAVGYGRDRSRRIVARPLPVPTIIPPVDLGLWSTVLDFARLDRALSSGKLLSGEALAELDTPALASDRRRGRGWGCCWDVTTLFGHPAEVHGGHGFGDGFYAVLERYPADGVAVFVFTDFGGSGPAYSVADLASSVALGEYPSGVEVEVDKLRQLAGVYEHRERRGNRVLTARVAIAVEHGRLSVTKAPGFELLLGPLLATSESTFVGQYAPALQLGFSRDPDGAGKGFLFRNLNWGRRIDFRRVGA